MSEDLNKRIEQQEVKIDALKNPSFAYFYSQK